MNSAGVKKALIKAIHRELSGRLERLKRAAKESQLAATDPDSKAESKYDTRNLEASYLAAGQARQVDELSRAVEMFERLSLPDYTGMGAVGPGALVELKGRAETSWYLLVPAAGGLEIDEGGRVVTLLSPDSPLYQQLLDRCLGDVLERPAGRIQGIF